MGIKKRILTRNYPRFKIPKFTPQQQKIIQISIFLGLGLLVGLFNWQSFATVKNNYADISPSVVINPANISQLSPLPKVHPLPSKLAQWQDGNNSGDYFQQIQTTNVGYLVWSNFPVRVYIETPANLNPEQAGVWVKAVTQTVQEWHQYLPLQIVTSSASADITIKRKVPPLQGNPPRARSALTTYELYSQANFLRHRFTILLSPSQSGKFLLAASRHELGHALGIWGHSSSQADALYFSQVANPPQISSRDVNTLKRVYQQPTTLGWKIAPSKKS